MISGTLMSNLSDPISVSVQLLNPPQPGCSFIRYNELLIIMNYWLLFLLLFNPVMILFILFLSIIFPLSLKYGSLSGDPTWQDVFWLYQHSTMFHHQKWRLKKIRVLLQTKMDSPVVKAGCRDILRYMGSADLKRLLATVTNGQIRTETDDGKYGTCRVFAIRCMNARAWRNVWAIMRTFFFFLLLLTGPLGLKFRNNSFWRFVPPTYFSFMFVYESYFQTALSALTGKCHWVASGMHRTSFCQWAQMVVSLSTSIKKSATRDASHRILKVGHPGIICGQPINCAHYACVALQRVGALVGY